MPVATWTDAAEDDLEDILRWLARRSVPAAERWEAAIARTCRLLARQPLTGTPRPDLAQDLYSRAVGRQYIVYYKPAAHDIEVNRVIHGARQVDPSMFSG